MKKLLNAIGLPTLLFSALIVVSCASLPGLKFKDTVPTDPWVEWGKYEPEFVIVNMPQILVEYVCISQGARVPPPGYKIMACADLGPKKPGEACQIFMSSDISHFEYVRILDHEKAHCRGWKHGDPQPRGTV